MEEADEERYDERLLLGTLRQKIRRTVQRTPEVAALNPHEVGIFFDRDGTINVDLDYLSDPEQLQLIPGAVDAIKEANDLGVRVFVITNQSGVARGLYDEKDVRAVHSRLQEVLKLSGAHIDALFYCPHHPDYGL